MGWYGHRNLDEHEVIEHFPKYEKTLARMRSSEFEEYIKHSDKVKKEFEQAIINEPGEKREMVFRKHLLQKTGRNILFRHYGQMRNYPV